MTHITGHDRCQMLLLPEAVDDYVAADNPVRFIDAFVDGLDLAAAGFARVVPEATGRPGYAPGDLLKLYIYGYLNRVRSSRRLEAETYRNLEVIWLLRHLRPDFKTIADFRRDNRAAFRAVFREFVLLCRQLDLFGRELLAIDGTRINAVNNKDRNFTRASLRTFIRAADAKGLSGNNRAICGISLWRDSVVPLAVEFGAFDIDCGHLGVRDDNAAGVLASVEFAAHGEAGFGGGGRDQFDDDPVADERLGAPVLADEGEEPVFDFVPLAGAGRQVADHNVEAEFVSQLLKFAFPQPHPRAVAAASVGGDQQPGRVGIAYPTDGLPPLADAIDGKSGRVMVDADTHPTRIGSEVIDPVGHRPSQFLD